MTHRGPHLRLEGSTLGPRKISAWREAVAPFWDIEVRREDAPDFRGRSEVYHLGNAILGFTAASELRLERSRGLVARMGVDHVAAQIRLEGHAEVRVAGREAPMGPGDLCLLDLSQPLAVDSSDYRAMTMILPRTVFPESGEALGSAHGAILRGDTPFGTLVKDHMRSLAANVAKLSPAEARAAVESTAILLAMAGRAAGGSGAPAQPADRVPLFLAIRRHIDTETDPAKLGIEYLCHRFGISRSALYRLFAPLGGVAEHIRSRRLGRAYRDLASGLPHAPRVSEIAYRYGYASPVGFTQAFRAEFGVSPADVRAGARSESALAGRRTASDGSDGSWGDFYDWVMTLDG
ncbi:helix-turn-helix domain-containing protein [Methylobacterium aerolatum]|uniref:AraC-like DNA-binding protein n=1 Tax=Methylobacterium aerolatum TaxID=418708 RepID=A0ABU0I6D6_9HYPH|nr:helix-turn-helix domain-containing protein [Methylobacterium aerolatum]MDQ0449261.1 AraC-like DNA-binding protein [Methylobacterium aerolatum]GJD35445.1 hypothetical protein FMGBMHLM_2355 [Methylobacterium aerolatum]